MVEVDILGELPVELESVVCSAVVPDMEEGSCLFNVSGETRAGRLGA